MHIGTLIYTLFNGRLVGTDEYRNRYYQSRSGQRHGRPRRWVLYRGKAEASKVPPEWHSWLHHTTDQPLTESAAQALPWQKQHLPNLTGTTAAYRPKGHDAVGGHRPHATGDYEPWVPQ